MQVLSNIWYGVIMTQHFSSHRGTREISRFSRIYNSVMFHNLRYFLARFYRPSRYLDVETNSVSYFWVQHFLWVFENGSSFSNFYVSLPTVEASKKWWYFRALFFFSDSNQLVELSFPLLRIVYRKHFYPMRPKHAFFYWIFHFLT